LHLAVLHHHWAWVAYSLLACCCHHPDLHVEVEAPAVGRLVEVLGLVAGLRAADEGLAVGHRVEVLAPGAAHHVEV